MIRLSFATCVGLALAVPFALAQALLSGGPKDWVLVVFEVGAGWGSTVGILRREEGGLSPTVSTQAGTLGCALNLLLPGLVLVLTSWPLPFPFEQGPQAPSFGAMLLAGWVTSVLTWQQKLTLVDLLAWALFMLLLGGASFASNRAWSPDLAAPIADLQMQYFAALFVGMLIVRGVVRKREVT